MPIGLAVIGAGYWGPNLVRTAQATPAFRLDWLFPRTLKPHVLLARLIFSFAVPWIVAVNQIRGSLTKKNPTNPQNQQA